MIMYSLGPNYGCCLISNASKFSNIYYKELNNLKKIINRQLEFQMTDSNENITRKLDWIKVRKNAIEN